MTDPPQPQPAAPLQPPPVRSRPSRSRQRPPAATSVALAIGATTAVLVAIALAEPGGGVLAVCCLCGGAVLAAVAVRSRNATAAVLACVLAATALAGLTGLALGRRASTSTISGHAFPLVVGLPLRRAEALFLKHGPVKFAIKRVAYGARGTVLRATGYAPDGSYAPGSTITLVVGTRVPAAGSPASP